MVDAFDYLESRDDADELIEEFGQTVSVRRLVASGTAWEPTLTPADYDTTAVILDFTSRQIDNENILRTDRRAIVAAGPLTALGITSLGAPDRLVVGGVAIPIMNVIPLNPAGTVVLFDCQLRV